MPNNNLKWDNLKIHRSMMRLPLKRLRHRKKWLCIPLLFIAFILLDKLFPLALPDQKKLFAQVVVDESGVPLRAFPDHSGVWRYETTLNQVSPYYIEALLTYEDRRFWYHPGVDPLAVFRAVIGNTIHRRAISGSSTITMQVGRLLHPHSKTLRGKLHQVFRALQLEWHLSKNQILTLYCNIAPFGGTIEGVQAASFTYLNKPATELSRAEAALLAVLPQSPTRYRPDLHPKIAQQARDKVLDRMVNLKQWSQEEVTQAKLEDVYAVHRSIEQHAPLLALRLANKTDKKVINTYINSELQIALEDYVKDYISNQAQNTSAAILVIENKTAHVKAYIGTAIFGDNQRFGHVDMVPAIRSPGSTLKPFLYALALDEGLIHSHSLLSDAPIKWGKYQPGNFGGSFTGPVSASEALQRSLNIPAVTLLDKIGPSKFTNRLNNAGLPLVIPGGKPSLAIILGGAGTSLEHLVEAYSAFANKGKTKPLQYSDQQAPSAEKFFFSPQAAWVVQNMLTGVSRPNSIRRPSSITQTNQLAWKTGTSYGARDAWAIGVNTDYTIGVWLGRPDGTSVPSNGGRTSSGPLLHAIADHLSTNSKAIAKPKGISQQMICWPLGTLESEQSPEHCHKRFNAWIIDGTIPPTLSDPKTPFTPNPFTFWLDSKQNIGGEVTNDCTKNLSKKQVALWPMNVDPWLPLIWRRHTQLPQTSVGCNINKTFTAKLKIETIQNNNQYRIAGINGTTPKLKLLASGGQSNHHWYINGKHTVTTPTGQYTNLDLSVKGKMQIVVTDDIGDTDRIEIFVQ